MKNVRLIIGICVLVISLLLFQSLSDNSNKNFIYYHDILVKTSSVKSRTKKYEINQSEDKYVFRVIKSIMLSDAVYYEKEISYDDLMVLEKVDYSSLKSISISEFLEKYYGVKNAERLYYTNREIEDPMYESNKNDK